MKDGGTAAEPARSWRPADPPEPGDVLPLVDSHCHLDQDAFADDRDAVIARARRFGVRRLITIGAGGPFESNRAAIALAEADPDVWAAVAVHPHDVTDANDETYEELRRHWAHPKVVAVGEIGLDYHYAYSPPETQRDHLRRFLREAQRAALPIVVHCRDAFDDLLPMVREEIGSQVDGIIHCFTGGPRDAEACLALGFVLSFSGIVTFPNAGPIREAAKLTPLDRMLVETDAPFLAPVPHRGRRNEPALVRHVVEELARVREMDVAEVARATVANTERVFRLPPPAN